MSRKPSRAPIAGLRAIARLGALAFALSVVSLANAQTLTGTFEGLAESSNEPIDIESDMLVMHNKDRYATFKGNVKAVQGDMVLRARELNVHIAGDKPAAAAAESSEAKDAEDPQETPQEKKEEGGDDGSQAGKVIEISDDPMDIEADVLVVHDKDKFATFRGNVKAVQGTSTLSAGELTVNYVGGGKLASAAQAPKALDAEGSAAGGARVTKIEAKGNVVITSKKDKGNSVLKGHRFVIDLTKDEAWVESAGNADTESRVRASFVSGDAKNAASADDKPGETGPAKTESADGKPGETGPQDITAANAGSEASDGGATGKEARNADGNAKGSKGNVTKIEAMGNVVISSGKDQTTASDWALYDVPSQSITVGGNVVLTQGQNVLKGSRLLLDLTTGESRFENAGTAAARGRIRGLFMPRDGVKANAKPADAKSAVSDEEAVSSGKGSDAGASEEAPTAGEPDEVQELLKSRP